MSPDAPVSLWWWGLLETEKRVSSSAAGCMSAACSAPSTAVLSVSVTGLMEYVEGPRAGFGSELLTCQAWGSGM